MKLTKQYKVRAIGTIAKDEDGNTLFVLDAEDGAEFITIWRLPPWETPYGVPKGDIEWT